MAIDFFSGLMQGLGQSIQQSRDNAARDKLLKAQVRLFEEQLKAREREAQREELQTAARGEVAQLTAQRKPGEELMSVLSPEMLGEAVRLGGIDQPGIERFTQLSQQERQQQAQTQFISGLPQQQQLAARAGGIEPFVAAEAPLTSQQKSAREIELLRLEQSKSEAKERNAIARETLSLSKRQLNITEEGLRMKVSQHARNKGVPDAIVSENTKNLISEVAVVDRAQKALNALDEKVKTLEGKGILDKMKDVLDPRDPALGELSTLFQSYLSALAKVEGTGALQASDIAFLESGLTNPGGVMNQLIRGARIRAQIDQSKANLKSTRGSIIDSRSEFIPDDILAKFQKDKLPDPLEIR